MKRSVIFSLILSASFLGLFSCGSVTEPEDSPPIIIPLQKGLTWAFSVTNWDAFGNPTEMPEETKTIITDTSMYGEQWSVIFLNGIDQLIRNTSNGVIVRLMANDDREHVLYKYPAVLGESHGYPLPVFGGGNPPHMDESGWTATVVAIDTVITVPAGSFKCNVYLVSPDPTHYYTLHFVSIGTGWIKYETHNYYITPANWQMTSTSELKSVALN